METYDTEEYKYVFDDIEFEQYIQSHDDSQPLVIGDIIANEGSEKQHNSGIIKYNQTPEKNKNEQNSIIEINHQLGLHSVLDCLHNQVCTALRDDDVSDSNCGLPIRYQVSRKNIRMGSELTCFENSEDAHRSENNIQCTAVKRDKSPILSDKQDCPPHLLSKVANNQNGEFRKPTLVRSNETADSNTDNRTLIYHAQTNERLYQVDKNIVKRKESITNTVIMVHNNESRDSNTDNRTLISQAQTTERLYQGGSNTVKRKESKTNTVIDNLFNCGDVQNTGTPGKQSTGSVNTEGSGQNNESPVMKRPYHDTGGTQNSSKEKFQCTKRPKINSRINNKKYFEKNSKN